MTNSKSKLSLVLGSAFVASMAASSVAVAAQNPFAMASLDKGYMVAAADMAKDAKSPEAKCGANKAGSDKMKDASCGAAKPEPVKAKDGKCGEGKCGSTKK